MNDGKITDAIQRVQKMRDDAEAEYDEEDLETLDSEPYGRYLGALDAYEDVLNVLQLLAHGIEPARGAP